MPGSIPAPMFACGGYDIADERLVSHREITIHADGDGPVPRLGDPFTIVRNDWVHDVIVLAVATSGPGWTARCGVVGVA
jgi:hypothetical protein